MTVLAILYGGYLAPHLPPSVAKWFTHPIFKIICFIVIILVYRWNPMVSLILSIAFIISLQTVSRQQLHHDLLSHGHPHDRVSPSSLEESTQFTQELTEQMNLAEQPEPLHPLNRPTEETKYQYSRIIDPNDPDQPSNKLMQDPNIDTAIYELNPPYAHQKRPINGCG